MDNIDNDLEGRKTTRGSRTLWFVFAAGLLFAFQQLVSYISGAVANAIDFSAVDKDNAFVWICVHHIVQMLVGLLAVVCLNKIYGLQFNLAAKKSKAGARYTLFFSLAVFAVTLVCDVVFYVKGLIEPCAFPLNATNVVGTLGFQLLLSRPSEKIVFRALPITILLSILYENGRREKTAAVVVSAFLFSIAHINWYTDPFSLSFSWLQLGYAFVFALVYGVTYIRTKSVIYPMIMHSLSNVIMVGLGYLFAA